VVWLSRGVVVLLLIAAFEVAVVDMARLVALVSILLAATTVWLLLSSHSDSDNVKVSDSDSDSDTLPDTTLNHLLGLLGLLVLFFVCVITTEYLRVYTHHGLAWCILSIVCGGVLLTMAFILYVVGAYAFSKKSERTYTYTACVIVVLLLGVYAVWVTGFAFVGFAGQPCTINNAGLWANTFTGKAVGAHERLYDVTGTNITSAIEYLEAYKKNVTNTTVRIASYVELALGDMKKCSTTLSEKDRNVDCWCDSNHTRMLTEFKSHSLSHELQEQPYSQSAYLRVCDSVRLVLFSSAGFRFFS
jgi:hypothetical protein